MLQVLKDIYSDKMLSCNLGFKGGTALMFFYDLPRFSVDIDFNLVDSTKETMVYEKVHNILSQYGTLHDEAMKFYGPILVLNYGTGERNLKVEISHRDFDNHYEIKNLLGIPIRVMKKEDMFAHKLCALLDRQEMTNRDIFDCWFFLQKRFPINTTIVETRMHKPFNEYVDDCIDKLEHISDKNLLNGLGEVLEPTMKSFVRAHLRTETIQLLRFFRTYHTS